MSEPKHPTHGDWDVVLETNQLYEAELAALRLREAGLVVQVVDQSYRQEPVPSVRSFAVVRVLVPSERADEARAALARGEPLPEDPSWDGQDDGSQDGEEGT